MVDDLRVEVEVMGNIFVRVLGVGRGLSLRTS